MNRIDILITCVILLFREREITKDGTYDSRNLVKSILNVTKPKRRDMLEGDLSNPDTLLIDLLNRMIANPEAYDDKGNLLAELKVIFKTNQLYYDTAADQLKTEMTDGGMKRSVNSMVNKVMQYYKSAMVIQKLNTLTYNLNTGNIKKTVSDDVMDILPELESLCQKTTTKDPGVLNTLQLSSKDDMDNIVSNLKATKEEGGILKTGWVQLNRMLQGGFRKGQMGTVNSLQHNYKSGFLKSIFMQVARFNRPQMKDPKKKPALIYLSFEDETVDTLEYMYTYLYYNENRKLPENTEDDIKNLTTEQIQDYVIKRLGQNGFESIIVRADPSMWTYQSIFNMVNQYEANGYEVQLLILDYLAILPTTGCDNSGPTGTALRDMFRRMRNFCSSKGIACISAHQLSSESKALVRNGIQDSMFVKEVAGKGYTEGSKQIDQVIDFEIYIYKAKINKQWHLTVCRGKHRGVGIIDDNLLYFTLPFPYRAPILENINDDHIEANAEDDTGDDLFE
nr:MAG TPA: DNA polymerase B Like Replicative Helicase [Caudoviricetes sp.]